MGGKKTEACGRCSVSSVVDLVNEDEDGGAARNPFDADRIELDEGEVRALTPHVVALGRLKDRLDRWATSITYGR